jgi:hypothetical protein
VIGDTVGRESLIRSALRVRTQTLADLYDLLVRGLRAAFGGYGGGLEANVGDFA